jgi:hypothetical protein
MLFLTLIRGWRVAEVPIIFVERRQGASKMSSRVMAESMITPWRLLLRGGRVRSDATRASDYNRAVPSDDRRR